MCTLSTSDIYSAHRLLHIRAETTKKRRGRMVPYPMTTGVLYATYLIRGRAKETPRHMILDARGQKQ
jgi:integrase/recombinase XerD